MLELQTACLEEQLAPLAPDGRVVVAESIVRRFLAHYHVQHYHQSRTWMLKQLAQDFVFSPLVDVSSILTEISRVCLHCQHFPKLVRREWHATRMAAAPREILHADFLMVEGTYILVLLDGFSRKCELTPCARATGAVVLTALQQWGAHYGLAPSFYLYTDRGSHFANHLLEEAAVTFGFRHVMAVSYSPFTNGTVEVMNVKILRLLRTLLSERCIPANQWQSLVPNLEFAINNIKMLDRDNLSPNEIWFGSSVGQGYSVVTDQPPSFVDGALLPPRPGIFSEMASLLAAQLEQLHRSLDLKATSHRDYVRGWRNARTATVVPQFGPGDWVLVSIASTHKERHKCLLRWQGPHLITGISSDNVYRVQDLLTSVITEVHAERLRFYEGHAWRVTDAVRDQVRFHARQYEVDALADLCIVDGTLRFTVHWRGFTLAEATHELVARMATDVPELVIAFTLQFPDHPLVPLLLQRLFVNGSLDAVKVAQELLVHDPSALSADLVVLSPPVSSDALFLEGPSVWAELLLSADDSFFLDEGQ